MLKPLSDFVAQHPYTTGLAGTFVLATVLQRALMGPSRTKLLLPTVERVLIVGATSGVGRELATLYAKRGAKVCIIGRRQVKLDEVKEECLQAGIAANAKPAILAKAADMTNPEDLVAVREYMEKEWAGVDTVHICAGVSALRPLMDVANSPRGKVYTSVEDIRHTGEIAQKAITGNFTGPLLTAITFIPQLQRTSSAPSILLISSVAALIPAPTRSLYCSSKASSLMLFRALAIEHPSITFSLICPGTIEGNFRASAVDGGDVREVLTGALKTEEVARRCMHMVDRKEGLVIIPWKYEAGLWASLLAPWYIDKAARKKYEFLA